MSISQQSAYVLASEIEWINAAARVRIVGLRRGQNRKQMIAAEYDPLAATCLAELIISRLSPTQPKETGHD